MPDTAILRARPNSRANMKKQMSRIMNKKSLLCLYLPVGNLVPLDDFRCKRALCSDSGAVPSARAQALLSLYHRPTSCMAPPNTDLKKQPLRKEFKDCTETMTECHHTFLTPLPIHRKYAAIKYLYLFVFFWRLFYPPCETSFNEIP